MRYDAIFIGAGLVILLAGEIFGMWMGMTGNFQLGPSHAHIEVVGAGGGYIRLGATGRPLCGQGRF